MLTNKFIKKAIHATETVCVCLCWASLDCIYIQNTHSLKISPKIFLARHMCDDVSYLSCHNINKPIHNSLSYEQRTFKRTQIAPMTRMM